MVGDYHATVAALSVPTTTVRNAHQPRGCWPRKAQEAQNKAIYRVPVAAAAELTLSLRSNLAVEALRRTRFVFGLFVDHGWRIPRMGGTGDPPDSTEVPYTRGLTA